MGLSGLIPTSWCQAQSNLPVHTYSASYASNHPDDFVQYTNEQYPWLRGKYVWNGKTDLFWRDGVWKDMTNGWRVVIYARDKKDTGFVVLSLGTAITNLEGVAIFTAPYNKFAKFELVNPDGKIVQPKPDAGTNLLKYYTEGIELPPNPQPWASPTNGSLVVDYPETILGKDYPQFAPHDPVGGIEFWFVTGPEIFSKFELEDIYSITNEGDYTLTVQPVLYRYQYYTRTNGAKDVLRTNNSEILRRVDLPSVTTKVHLVPNAN